MATRFYRERCSGCGAKIEVVYPVVHVVSKFTGNYYCARCCVNGLPKPSRRPITKQQAAALRAINLNTELSPATRRELKLLLQLHLVEQVSDGSYRLTVKGTETIDGLPEAPATKERRPAMASTKTETAPQSTEVLDALLEQVKGLGNVELLPKSGYVTLKTGGKTFGYINGKSKLRIDFPVSGGERSSMTVKTVEEIPAAVERLTATYQAVTSKQQAVATAAADKAAKAEAKKAKADATPATEAEVTPDPKPSRKSKTASRS
jgi:hypothetical protein